MVLIIENLDNLLHLEKNRDLEPPGPRGEEYCSKCSKINVKSKKDDFLTFIKEIGQTEKINLILTSTEANDFSIFFPIELIELQALSEEDSSSLFKERDQSLDETTVKNWLPFAAVFR